MNKWPDYDIFLRLFRHELLTNCRGVSICVCLISCTFTTAVFVEQRDVQTGSDIVSGYNFFKNYPCCKPEYEGQRFICAL